MISVTSRHPFAMLLRARLREFVREPEVVFWVFGFPILLALGLGIAFREKPQDTIVVGIVDGPGAAQVEAALPKAAGFEAKRISDAQAVHQLRMGKIALVISPGADPSLPVALRFDPTRPESASARLRVDDALQRAAGRKDPLPVAEKHVTEPGARYIDFLIPGLLGMNIMSGGMWGVGYALVEMRVKKLLKRLAATPMRRGDFLGAMMTSRAILVVLEVLVLLGFGWLVFGLPVRGSLALITAAALLGGFTFSGLGMLVASRARKTESVAGLMNLVMMPMFVFSGVFFSADRFPDVVQPLVRALPLTALNDLLRAVILEGAGVVSQTGHLAILLAWGGISFVVALRVFRWS